MIGELPFTSAGVITLRLRGVAQLFLLSAIGLASSGCEWLDSTMKNAHAAEPRYVSEISQRRIQAVPASAAPSASTLDAFAVVDVDEEHVARVMAPTQGRVREVSVRPGDTVRKGEPLAKVFSEEVADATGDFASARAKRIAAEAMIRRGQILTKNGAASDHEIANIGTVYEQARARESREAQRVMILGGGARIDASYTIKSPIAGVVIERNIARGSLVGDFGSAPSFVVADLDYVVVVANVLEQDLPHVHVGQSAAVRVPSYPGRTFRGAVNRISDTVERDGHVVQVRIRIDNRERLLKPGMNARALFEIQPHDEVAAPKESVFAKGGKTFVYVEENPGRFVARQVIVGARTESHVHIASGVTVGERVVFQGGALMDSDAHQRF